MEYELVEIKKYKLNMNGRILLVLVNKKDNLTEFYIQEKCCGTIKFMICISLNALGCTEEEFINNNIKDWAFMYDEYIKREYKMKEEY